MKTPIALIIDDAAPRVFVFREHAKTPFTKDGRPLLDNVPNSFLDRFCDAVERYGIAGKFSVVPSPGGRGDIVNGLDGFPREELDYWLDTVKRRITPTFALCPEMINHWQAVNLTDGGYYEENEAEWSQHQDRTALIPYITRALQLCRDAGLDCTGVTSPWDFGVKVEDEYAFSIGAAMEAVYGRTESWYFCRGKYEQPDARPWISLRDRKRTVVAIPGTIHDRFWQSMDTTDVSDAYVSWIADKYISADGKSGEILNVLNTNGYPILTTHWQSLFSNGAETGLKALAEVARRVEEHLSDRVVWTHFDALMRETIDA